MVKRYRVSNRLLIVGKDAPDVFDLHNLDVVLAEDYEVLERRCKGLETTAIRLEGELAECKGYLAAAEKGHDAAHEACVQYEAALREAMGWNWLTDYELIPADVRSRLEALTLETNSVSVSSKSASTYERLQLEQGIRSGSVTDPSAPETACSIYEHDGAFKCYVHNKTWGAVSNPSTPCVGWSATETGAKQKCEQCVYDVGNPGVCERCGTPRAPEDDWTRGKLCRITDCNNLCAPFSTTCEAHSAPNRGVKP